MVGSSLWLQSRGIPSQGGMENPNKDSDRLLCGAVVCQGWAMAAEMPFALSVTKGFLKP